MYRWFFRTVIAVGFLMLPVFPGGFLYAQAQASVADLALESVSVSGDTAVVYRNDGAAISGQPYTVSFQWVDTSGVVLASKQTLTRNTLAASGRETLGWSSTSVEGIIVTQERRCYQTGGFFNRRTQCDYIQVPRTVTQSLAAYRASRPRPDALLAVMLDDGNRITETSENNNSARVGDTPFRGAPPAPLVPPTPPSPPAELVLTRATFDGVYLFVVFQNQSAVNITNKPFDVGLQWLDKNGSAVGDRRFFRYKNLASGKVEIIDSKGVLFTLEQTGPGLNDITTAEPLPLYLLRRPSNAAKLSVTVDDRNQITEVSKTNNAAVIDLPNPDLLIVDQALTSRELSFKYVNAGAAPLAGSSVLSFWFEWVDAKGARVADNFYWYNRDAFSVRQNAPVAFTSNGIAVYSTHGMFTLNQILQNPPTEAAALKVTIDGPNVFTELSKTNNAVVLPIPVVPLPDLTITKQVQILNQQRLVFSYTNASAAPLTQFPTLSFWFEWVDAKGARVGDLYWQDRSASAALPNVVNIFNSAGVYVMASGGGFSSLDFLLQYPPSSATHLKITIDGPNKFRETDEKNNVALLPLSKSEVAKSADLRIADFTIDPIVLRAGERVWFVARVENVGGAATGSPTATGIILDNELASRSIVGQFTTASIPAGESATVRWTKENYYGWVAVEGTHTIEVCADRAKVIEEMDETNNCARKEITVSKAADEKTKLPDLTIDSVNVKDGYVRIVVKNVGEKASGPTDIWLMWFAGSRALSVSAAVSLPDISPLSTVVVPVSLDKRIEQTEAARILQDPPKDGTQLRVYLDGSRRVTEVNEDNNDAFFDRAQLPAPKPEEKKKADSSKLPDLRIAEFTLDPPAPKAGDRVRFTASVFNGGDNYSGQVSVTSLDIDLLNDGTTDFRKAQFVTSNLAPNESQTHVWRDGIEYEWVAINGTHAFTVCADRNSAVREADETNNCVRRVLNVGVPPAPPEKPDLTVDGVGFLPLTEIVEKDRAPFEAVFTAIVSNQGKKDAGASRSRVRVDLGSDGTWDAVSPTLVQTPGIKVGEQTLVKLPLEWNARVGTYPFEVCADPGRNIDESDETNNCATDRFTLKVGEAPSQEEDTVAE